MRGGSLIEKFTHREIKSDRVRAISAYRAIAQEHVVMRLPLAEIGFLSRSWQKLIGHLCEKNAAKNGGDFSIHVTGPHVHTAAAIAYRRTPFYIIAVHDAEIPAFGHGEGRCCQPPHR